VKRAAIAVTETLAPARAPARASPAAAPAAPPAAAGAAPVAPAPSELLALRRRLAGCTAQEAVLADFLEDDLREAEGALTSLTAWVGGVNGSLRDRAASRHDLLAMALAEGPLDDLEYLHATVLSLRRRLAQIAVRLPAPSR
jgi:hypothetical protein